MSGPSKRRSFPFAAVGLCALVAGLSVYANLSWEVKNPADYACFPPFKAGFDRNMNLHLGAEYLNIAIAIREGRGFSDPFDADTGPTAWMPPVLPCIEVGLLSLFEGDLDGVMNAMIVLQNIALMLSAWLVLRLCGQSRRWWVATVFAAGLMLNFRNAFQTTHDFGLLMLVMDGLVVGLCWGRPLASRRRSFFWGLYGAFATLCSPVAGFAWALLTAIEGRSVGVRKAWLCYAVFALALVPWTVRNYREFGQFIPVKSNLAYELYQSQCLQPGGVLRSKTFGSHPWVHDNRARQDYRRLGETEFLREKGELFKAAVRQDPWDFVRRVRERLLAVTLVYEQYEPEKEKEFPEALWASYLAHPLPFIGWCWLLAAYIRGGLARTEKTLFWLYPAYLLPYVFVSYYNRYEFPLLAVKWVLVIWLGDRVAGSLSGSLRAEGIVPESSVGLPSAGQ